VSKSLTGGQAFACRCVAPAGQSRNLYSALHLGLPISYVPEIVRAFAWAELSQGVGEGVRGGVNIAARLEGLCEPGGVLISGAASDHARGKIDAHFLDLGDKELKNIVGPIRVYSLDVGAPAVVKAAPPSTTERSAPPRASRSSSCRSPISAETRSRSISSMA
jgi:hypothetical protein